MAVKKDPRTIEVAEPFVSLFPVEPDVLDLVKASMRENGYQADKPILVWRDAFGESGRQVVVDGHTRLKASLALKLPEIWTTVRQYKSLDAAITAAIEEQVQRRNLDRRQIAALVIEKLPMLDEAKGGLRTRTAKELAAMLGVSIPTIDRARGVIASGDADLIDRVKAGDMSMLAAYEATTTPKAAPPPPEPSRARAASPPEDRVIGDGKQRPTIRSRKAARDAWEASRLLDVSYQVTKASDVISKVTIYLDSVEIKDLALDTFDLDDVALLREDMAYLQEWMDRCVAAVDARLGENGLRKTIAAIRAKTVARGATPEEAALAKAVADRMEKRLVKKLASGSAA